MIDLNYINNYYPPQITSNAAFQKHILKEYIQLMVLVTILPRRPTSANWHSLVAQTFASSKE